MIKKIAFILVAAAQSPMFASTPKSATPSSGTTPPSATTPLANSPVAIVRTIKRQHSDAQIRPPQPTKPFYSQKK